MFRYADVNNYYRFSMDSQRGYRRLVKNVAGTFSLLWEDDFAYEVGRSYEVGREYLVTLDCEGSRLSGYLDAVPLFTFDDPDLTAGQIGLYCWANEDARFLRVQVAASVWETYYHFNGEEDLPAGTRVQVFAGNESELPVPTAEPAQVRRFVAILGDAGTTRLRPSDSQLRLVAPDGATVHSRRFLPPSDYTNVADARVLRKADGTAFVIIRPSVDPPGSSLPQGEYRLKLVYRRDNQVVDPDSQVFSQAGFTVSEVVTLDVPWQSH